MTEQNPSAAEQAERVTDKVARLRLAKSDILEAIRDYAAILGDGPEIPAAEIDYVPSTALLDNHRYLIEQVNTRAPYQGDQVLNEALRAEAPVVQAYLLSLSPHWEDRIRAEVLTGIVRRETKLPNDFPCIYEPAESPNQQKHLHPAPNPWVVSADEDMLNELLPLYQELWTAYENQWPHTPNREFVVGRLNGLSPRGVNRPGTTAAQVIGQTMITHEGLYRTAPEHLREMHPQHAMWAADRLRRRNETNV